MSRPALVVGINRYRTLSSVADLEHGRDARFDDTHVTALITETRQFDFDRFGALIDQHSDSQRPGKSHRQLHDFDAVERSAHWGAVRLAGIPEK